MFYRLTQKNFFADGLQICTAAIWQYLDLHLSRKMSTVAVPRVTEESSSNIHFVTD